MYAQKEWTSAETARGVASRPFVACRCAGEHQGVSVGKAISHALRRASSARIAATRLGADVGMSGWWWLAYLHDLKVAACCPAVGSQRKRDTAGEITGAIA